MKYICGSDRGDKPLNCVCGRFMVRRDAGEGWRRGGGRAASRDPPPAAAVAPAGEAAEPVPGGAGGNHMQTQHERSRYRSASHSQPRKRLPVLTQLPGAAPASCACQGPGLAVLQGGGVPAPGTAPGAMLLPRCSPRCSAFPPHTLCLSPLWEASRCPGHAASAQLSLPASPARARSRQREHLAGLPCPPVLIFGATTTRISLQHAGTGRPPVGLGSASLAGRFLVWVGKPSPEGRASPCPTPCRCPVAGLHPAPGAGHPGPDGRRQREQKPWGWPKQEELRGGSGDTDRGRGRGRPHLHRSWAPLAPCQPAPTATFISVIN